MSQAHCHRGHRRDQLEIAKYFFNSISRSNFLGKIGFLLRGEGVGNDGNGCFFPEDDDEKPFEGVLFTMMDEELIVDLSTFEALLKEACEGYARLFPECRDQLNEVLITHGRSPVIP